jgi:hypothetical protein
LKVDLNRWNEEVFGKVERKKKVLLEEPSVLCIRMTLGVEKIMKKAEIVSELERSTLM